MAALRYLMILGISLGLLVCFASFLPSWPGDMLSPFRIQTLVCAMIALSISAFLKKRWLMGLAVFFVVLNAFPMAARMSGRTVLPPHSQQSGTSVSLVFANVLCDNQHFDKVITLAQFQDADIFAAAETSPVWIEKLSALKSRYAYSYAPNLGIFGIAIYAKRPFSARTIKIGTYGMALVRADFGQYVLYVAHPMPPATKALNEDNRIYLSELANLISAETKPVIVTGDLNSTLWSYNMTPLIQQKMQWPHGSGTAYSWPAKRPFMAIQIDHVLTRRATSATFRILDDVGSDHLPVRADLVL